MDTTIKALQTLYVKFGGSATTVANITTIPDMINAIATVAESAVAPELPAVTSEENGKVLKVVNGKWAVGTDEIQA